MNLKRLILYCFALLATGLVAGCLLNKKKKITYNIPANYPEARKQQIITLFDKGEELYKQNCAECHGIFTAGKVNIPNFTTHQLDNYSSKFMMRDLRNHAVAAQMSGEQLNDVLVFLRFLKRDKVDSTPLQRGRRF